jgi:hypothetical protein
MTSESQPPVTVLLLCRDLLFASQLHGAILRAGLKGRTCLSQDGCLEQLKQPGIRDVIIDLETPDLDLPALRQASPAGCRLTATGPHVKTELFEVARQAGCDTILTRGKAFSQLDTLLRKWNEAAPST